MDRPTTAERLARAGWTRRSTASEPRLSEVVTLYESLGFEVRLEPVSPDELPAETCGECFWVRSGRFFTVYTRPAASEIPR